MRKGNIFVCYILMSDTCLSSKLERSKLCNTPENILIIKTQVDNSKTSHNFENYMLTMNKIMLPIK